MYPNSDSGKNLSSCNNGDNNVAPKKGWFKIIGF